MSQGEEEVEVDHPSLGVGVEVVVSHLPYQEGVVVVEEGDHLQFLEEVVGVGEGEHHPQGMGVVEEEVEGVHSQGHPMLWSC